jgi:hypothetical protein
MRRPAAATAGQAAKHTHPRIRLAGRDDSLGQAVVLTAGFAPGIEVHVPAHRHEHGCPRLPAEAWLCLTGFSVTLRWRLAQAAPRQVSSRERSASICDSGP